MIIKLRENSLYKRIVFLALLFGCLKAGNSLANDLQIDNLEIVSQSISSGTATIQFDIAWDNSWKNFTSYDAVWFFIKYLDGPGSSWQHGTFASFGANPSGFYRGSGTDVDIIVPPDKAGCFIQRSDKGSGSLDTNGIRIVWDYQADGLGDDLTSIGLKLFAIEMVYIPQGPFFAGDNQTSTAAFDQGKSLSESDPWYITSENAINVTDVSENGYYYNSAGNTGENASGDEFIIPVSFPKGYDAFYIMKYEISQGQYGDFLNTISVSQAFNRYPDQDGNNRHAISGAHPNYFDARPDRACNYLSWMDICAYADWAALRPLSELEFEKAARGKDVMVTNGEYAWGNTSITQAATIIGTEDGRERLSNVEANCNYNNQTFSGGDGGAGPLRAGIFSTSTSSRQQAGASYYGVMELSGNVWERCVTAGNSAGRSFQGMEGDGVLETSAGCEGNATNIHWPGYVNGQGVSGAVGSGFRGGGWQETTAAKMAVSDRSKAAYTDISRGVDMGGRCARGYP
ncbi:MAG: SUMF1/EgtB/PvdO family nonheme iron enzyme [Candidatus Omnitrophota bacterium]